MLVTNDELKQLLIKTKILDEKKFADVVEYAKNSNIPVTDALIEKDIITDENLGIIIADYLKIPFVVLSKINLADNVSHIIPESFARKQRIIPFARDAQGIKVAMANPKNTEVLNLISQKTGQKVIPHYATERDIFYALKIYQKDLQKKFDDLIREQLEESGIEKGDDAPIEKIVTAIIKFAYADQVSDIHIEAQEDRSLVRFRIDGILHDVLVLPKTLHDQVTTRIKVISKLRTDEHLAPQDGKMRVHLDEEDLDIRVSILPMTDGEKVVMRLLASKFRQFSLTDLGMSEKDLQKVQNAYSKSFGMVLSTGPTGSGKSTSIYAILKILNIREKNITTIEDPVEYKIRGINQIQVNAKTNLTFAAGLRSILRQDPNIIFVGEIRDNETGGIAVNAALTGHLVLSTLHTNDAAGALPRLIEMEVEPFLVASTVNVIIGQRLIRKICEMCKTSIDVTHTELIKNLPPDAVKKHFGDSEKVRVYKGKGCAVCHTTGYSGRLGLFEVLSLSKDIRELITKRADADEILDQAIKEGMTTMLDDGLQKVIKGLTSIEEVLRVTKFESN